MKISLDWLGDLVSWEDSSQVLAEKLTAAGLNVEGIEEFKISFPGVVIAKVISKEQHPDADRLSLCQVDAGTDEPVQVVCGAPNVAEGLTVVFATVGAVLPGNFKIKKSKIRGVQSFGMICSATELELGTDGDGIIELETELPVGTSVDELYGYSDTVLDIEVTPNRPDWLSHIGVAREVAAIYGTKVSFPRTWSSQQTGESLGKKVRILDYADCPRYSAFGARSIEVGPSPNWMQHRLLAIGSRPINNVVDITNYVMFETGQPMHAFDQSKLSGITITIKKSEKGQKVVTLDNQERNLEEGTLLVCDDKGPVALAGVMGLANSEVDSGTRNIILESAFFDSFLVRKASRELNLISESSYRFERGGDWEMVIKAAHRALYLLQEHAAAHIVTDWADRFDPDRTSAKDIPLRIWQVNRVLGTEISTDQAATALQALGLKVQPMGNPAASTASAVNIMVKVPTFRRDLFQEIDLVEEIARSYGFDNMKDGAGFTGATVGLRNTSDIASSKIRSWFAACGYTEIVTSTFMVADDQKNMQMPEEDMRFQSLAVMNSHSGGDLNLRTHMLPSVLDVICRNLNSGAPAPLRLFQNNRVYWPAGRKAVNPLQADDVMLPEEPIFLQFAVAGNKEKGLDNVPADLLEIKGVVEALSSYLRVPLNLEVADVEPWLVSGQQWKVTDEEGTTVGSAGRVSGKVLQANEIDVPVAVAEINLDLLNLEPREMKYEPFVRFPEVKRDLSLLVPNGTVYGKVEQVVLESGGVHLESVELFDIYRGKGVTEGHGAYGIRLKFRSAKGNLKGKTVDYAIKQIIEALASRLKIEHR